MGFHNAPGHLVKTADALAAISAEAKHLVDSDQIQIADAMMSKLFGQRAGANLLPVFAEGPEHMAEIQAAVQKHGLAMHGDQAEQASKFATGWKDMTAAVDGLKVAIGEGLFSVLTPVIEKMTNWLDTNRDWIALKVEHFVTELGKAFKNIDWDEIIGGFKSVFSWAGWIAKKLDELVGPGGTIVILAGISFAPTILEFGKLGAAVASAAGKYLLFPVAAMIGDFFALVPAIGSASEAFAALNLVMAANPLGLAVIAAAALGAVAYEIYEHWDGVVDFFKGLWADVTAVFDAAWQKIKPIVEALKDAGDFLARTGGVGATMPAAPEGYTRGSFGELIPLRPGEGIAVAPQLIPPRPGEGVGAAPQSSAKVTVEFQNLPPGARVGNVETRGNPDLDLNVGYAMPY